MFRRTASKRGRRGAKTLDLAQLKAALRDGKFWTGLGVVRVFPGETSHFEIVLTGEAEPGVDLMVELASNGERLVCRLGATGGTWRIPAPGTEVAVLIPEGDLESDPIVVAILEDPPGLLGETNIVIAAPGGSEVLIYDGSGTPESLATKADLQAFKNIYDTHTHACTGTTGGGGSPGVAAAPVTPAPTPAGTSVLKAK